MHAAGGPLTQHRGSNSCESRRSRTRAAGPARRGPTCCTSSALKEAWRAAPPAWAGWACCGAGCVRTWAARQTGRAHPQPHNLRSCCSALGSARRPRSRSESTAAVQRAPTASWPSCWPFWGRAAVRLRAQQQQCGHCSCCCCCCCACALCVRALACRPRASVERAAAREQLRAPHGATGCHAGQQECSPHAPSLLGTQASTARTQSDPTKANQRTTQSANTMPLSNRQN